MSSADSTSGMESKAPAEGGVSSSAAEALSALGYLSFVEDEQAPDLGGVLQHDPSLSEAGITVFGSGRNEAELYWFGMDGEELARWRVEPSSGRGLIWQCQSPRGTHLTLGRRALYELDGQGNLLWEAPSANYHHDVHVGADGLITTMAHHKRAVTHQGVSVQVTDDLLLQMTAEGELLREVSILDLLGPEIIDPKLLDQLVLQQRDGQDPDLDLLGEVLAVDNAADVFHLNSVVVLDRDIGVGKLGDWLISLRSLDLVLILDPVTSLVVWRWDAGREFLDRPHRPALLDNGNLLIFDNGWRRGHSRVIELDPRSEEIVWRYSAQPPEAFFSKRGGMAEALPGGNVLITEADRGRLFEVTRAGQVVWEFLNPIRDQRKAKRQTIYRAWRMTDAELERMELDEALRQTLIAKGYLGS